MKNLNWNSGFTLIELLAVIILIAILALFAIPSAIEYLRSSSDKLTSVQKENIKDAAKMYYDDCVYGDGIEGVESACKEFLEPKFIYNKNSYCITLEKLVSLKYIEKIYVNKKLYSCNINVIVDQESESDVNFEIVDNSDFNGKTYDLNRVCSS